MSLAFYIKFSIGVICEIVIRMCFLDEKAVVGKMLSTTLVSQAKKAYEHNSCYDPEF